MEITVIESLYSTHKENALSHRYINNNSIKPLLDKLPSAAQVTVIGHSVLKAPIYGIKLGVGAKKVLMWSQMHGNESTTTKAVFDLLNTLLVSQTDVSDILKDCTLYIIPILSPDGAHAYTRINANKVDLNRDAQALTQPESKVLRAVYNSFKPDFCFNLHGQRTIFSAGETNNIATVSFLSPAQDQDCTVTPNRQKSMEVIAAMNKVLQQTIPNQVGVYDDAFNINCVGDTFQSENTPTILFEAGHFKSDYAREETRRYIYASLLSGLNYIAKNNVSGDLYKPYFDITENGKCFLDIIIRNAKVKGLKTDVGILFVETLIGGKVEFVPKIVRIENLNSFYGHREINANNNSVLTKAGEALVLELEVDVIVIKSDEIQLALK